MTLSIDEILSLASELKPPDDSSAEDVFSSRRLPGRSDFHIGIDKEGRIAVLLASEGTELAKVSPILLHGISLRIFTPCILHQAGDTRVEGVFTIVTCRSREPLDRELFLRVMTAFIQMVNPSPTTTEVLTSLDHLVQLFRSLESPARTTIQGLWAELCVIACSDKPSLLLSSWHTNPEELWDFTLNTQHLEIKSSTEEQRLHHFSLRQLQPLPHESLIVGSIFVCRTGQGHSVDDLLRLINQRQPMQPTQIFRVEHIIAASLGMTWRETISDRFSLDRAKDSLQYYRSEMIPSISSEAIPIGITDVRFRVDLSQCPHLDREERRRIGELFAVLGGP